MAKKKIENETETADPTPVNRMVKSGSVRVRATCHIVEEVHGAATRFAPGDEFELPSPRAKALGPLVEILCLWLMLLAATAYAGPVGYETKSASGTTNAGNLHFPGSDNGIHVVTLDVTSDKAGSLAKWATGTTPSRLAAPATATDTNFYVWSGVFVTNSFLLAQNATNGVALGKVLGTNTVTSVAAKLGAPLGVTTASGDAVKRILPTRYVILEARGATSTNYPVDNLTGLVAAETVTMLTSTGNVVRTVHAVATNTLKSVPVSPRVPCSLVNGDAVYERSATVYAIVNATIAYDATTITVSNLNGIAGADRVLIETAGGNRAVRVVDSVSTSNVVLTVAAGFALAAGDTLKELTSSDYIVKQAALAGDARVTLNTTNGLVAGDNLVFVSAAEGTHLGNMLSVASDVSEYSLDLTATVGIATTAGLYFQELTNVHAVNLASAAGDGNLNLNNVTNLTIGDPLLITASGGGNLVRTYTGTDATNAFVQVITTGTLGIPLARDNHLYLVGATNSVAVGAASVSRIGEAIFVAPPGRPATLNLDGTTTVSINSVTVKY